VFRTSRNLPKLQSSRVFFSEIQAGTPVRLKRSLLKQLACFESPLNTTPVSLKTLCTNKMTHELVCQQKHNNQDVIHRVQNDHLRLSNMPHIFEVIPVKHAEAYNKMFLGYQPCQLV
jgi:hypothetical protein